MAASGLPEVQMAGVGEITPPAVPQQASYQRHYQEYRSRGLSHADADHYARGVVERDNLSREE